MRMTVKDVLAAVASAVHDSNLYDVYPGYEHEPSDDPYHEYFFETKMDAQRFARQTADHFKAFPRWITVYRALDIPSGNPDDIYGDWGESWSYERDAALDFGERADANFLLTGEVQDSNVDWPETLRRYIEFTVQQTEGEYELVVESPTKIRNVTVERI